MRTTRIRQQLHDYIDNMEDKKLKAFDTLLEVYMTDDFTFTNAQKRELDKRYDDYKNGTGETVTWEETNNAATIAREQILMLRLSDHDINTGKIISQDELDKNDLRWLKYQ